jgi:hypothetical protein
LAEMFFGGGEMHLPSGEVVEIHACTVEVEYDGPDWSSASVEQALDSLARQIVDRERLDEALDALALAIFNIPEEE